MKIFKGLVSKGVLGAQHVVVQANSPEEAILIIKSEGRSFSYSEVVQEDYDLRSYIRSKVESGVYEFLGVLPNWM